MPTVYYTPDPNNPNEGFIDEAVVDATTEEDIARQIIEDEEAFRQEVIEHLRNIRTNLGFSQTEFAKLLNVSVTSIRNWEQGKRFPTGAARTLYRILDRAPEAAIEALVYDHEFAA